MGCSSSRTKYANIRPEQKWDFVSLDDFKSTSCFTTLAYAYLYVSLGISIAVYGVDTFTAVNLLAFNKWTSQISPAISISISKWIFAICIILSWVNIGFEWVRAIRVMRRGAVAESYLDPLAVRIQSIRPGKGRGWRRFLVFAELTKSKKGAEYVALFAYFSFKAWIRIIFCSGPRQVINAITLYSVYTAKLDPKASDIGSSFKGFFKNIEILAEGDYQQAVVLSGMIFTLVIWVFAALSLLFGLFLYVFFLWHYIPNRDGGLSGYCERKINSRLTKIVSAKVNKALEDEERRKKKAEQKAIKNGEKSNRLTATLPVLSDVEDDEKLPEMPMLSRHDTMTTLPLYTSRPGTPARGAPPMPDMELNALCQKRPHNGRTITQNSSFSNESYNSNAPLIGGASDMGYGRAGSPAPSQRLPPLDTNNRQPGPQRTMTGSTNGSAGQQNNPQAMRMASNGSVGPPRFAQGPCTQSPVPFSESPVRLGESQSRHNTPGPQQTADNYGRNVSAPQQRFNSPGPQQSTDIYGRNSPAPHQRFNSPAPQVDNYGRPLPQQSMGNAARPLLRQVIDPQSPRSPPGSVLSQQPTLPDIEAGQPTLPNISSGMRSPARSVDNGHPSPALSQMGRSSPAPQSNYDVERPAATLCSPLHPGMRSGTAPVPNSSRYVAYNPSMRSASAAPNASQQQQWPNSEVPRPQYRNMTAPVPQTQAGNFFGPPRMNTPQQQQGPPRVGTPQGQGQPPRQGTPNSMPHISDNYRQPTANDAESPQSYRAYQYPDNGSSTTRPRPPPPDDRY